MADAKLPHDAAHGGWSGRFSEPVSERVKRYTASVHFDRRLAEVDIAGSLAHARMLAAAGVLSRADLAAIEGGMQTIRGEIERGEFAWSTDLEDVHLNIESRLTALVGDAGKRLHTARSRNDQVATDLRMWLRGAIDALVDHLAALRHALLDLAERHADTIMPGYTHLQVAQPVTFGHHLLAYDTMLARDMERFADCRSRVNRLPLGAAALAGTSYPIDRGEVARALGFDALCPNSIDAVSDRDFAIEFAAAATLVMLHLSRFALMKSQPLAYNKDNQEDKEPLFDIVDTLADTLAIMADLVAGGITVDAERMRAAAGEGYATATDLADYLVRKGVPFRDAHEAVARAVRHAEAKQVELAALPLAELQTFAAPIRDDVFDVLTLEGSVASRNHPGGTSPAQVRAAIAAAHAELDRRAAARRAV